VVPAGAQNPEQHIASVEHRSLSGRQPPGDSHVATPTPLLSTQAPEQQVPEGPTGAQGSFEVAQDPIAAQWPTVAAPGRSQ
jgi:hypothetical protein